MGSKKDGRHRKELPTEVNAGLRWTGHALVDVGIAGACVYRERERPEDLTLDDLDRVSEFIVETYYQAKQAKLGTYLSCVFMNASFVQPNESGAKRRQFIAVPVPDCVVTRCSSMRRGLKAVEVVDGAVDLVGVARSSPMRRGLKDAWIRRDPTRAPPGGAGGPGGRRGGGFSAR